jgi:cell division protein ZapD
VRGVKGQLGQALRNDDFLNSIVQRSSIAGGGFDFDLPQYHYWLQMPLEARSGHLDAWRDQVAVVQFAVDLLLNLIRSSAVPQEARADGGLYQQSLPANAAAQLVRVHLPAASDLYAEVSGGKHRFTVRIMDCSDWQHPVQVDGDVPFSLTTCLI